MQGDKYLGCHARRQELKMLIKQEVKLNAMNGVK